MNAAGIRIEIVADTRRFRRALLATQIRLERSRLRRFRLRLRLWRLNRDLAGGGS